MNALHDMSVKQVFSTLRENFTTQEFTMIEIDIDQLLESSQSMDQLIARAKETLENKKITSVAA